MRDIKLLTMVAIADARGVCFEYAPKRIIRERNNWDVAYFPHHKFGTGAGLYSDDAQMTLAVAETLLDCGKAAAARDFAEHFVTAFKREDSPREGYASAFQQFLIEVGNVDEFLERIRPESNKSGAAMRAGPCGLLVEVGEVLEVSARQARVTHDTPEGIAAAQAAALMVHYGYRDLGAKADLPAWLDMHVPGFDWGVPHKGEVGPRGIDSVRAALTSYLRVDSFADLLIDCVNFGGDVDTVAAIAAAAASCAGDFDQTIPAGLLAGLEDGPFGRTYLEGIDRRLSEFAASA